MLKSFQHYYYNSKTITKFYNSKETKYNFLINSFKNDNEYILIEIYEYALKTNNIKLLDWLEEYTEIESKYITNLHLNYMNKGAYFKPHYDNYHIDVSETFTFLLKEPEAGGKFILDGRSMRIDKNNTVIFNGGNAGIAENVTLTINKKKPEDKEGSPDYKLTFTDENGGSCNSSFWYLNNTTLHVSFKNS